MVPGGDGTGPMGSGRGRGTFSGKFDAGPGGACKCPSCGHELPHATGEPCNERKCPKCGSMMTRV